MIGKGNCIHLGVVVIAALETALRTVEPATRLVHERHLRALLHYLGDHGECLSGNPHVPLWVTRAAFQEADIRGLAPSADDPPRLLLLLRPTETGSSAPPPDQVRAYWRLMFQAAVMASVDDRLADHVLNEARCAHRLAQLGSAAEREVRYVLEAERLVGPTAGPAMIYRAFSATYLDLHAFAASEIREFFPSLPSPTVVVGIIGKGLDLPALLARTRPPGVADPIVKAPILDSGTAPPTLPPTKPGLPADSSGLLTRAADAERRGNLVRAAVLRAQATSGETASPAEVLGPFIESLARTLGWATATTQEWQQALVPLLVRAGEGFWPRAARCLYELQKVPADLSREVYAVELVEVIRTLGRRPLKRPLHHAREVMILVRLRAAHRQLLKSGLEEQAQSRLDGLFRHEIHRVEQEVRTALTPRITTALAESGFEPGSRVEEVARAKVVAELLDRICERGYLRLGDLRDAIARNQFKMPDLAGPVELVGGDALLRTDTRLAYDLDGVYRRGEAYLRLLQRGSSVFFGTRWGRFLTLYAIAPFLAAFIALYAVAELTHIGGKVVTFTGKILAPRQPTPPPVAPAPTPTPAVDAGDDDDGDLIDFDTAVGAVIVQEAFTASKEEHHGSILTTWPVVVGLGVFLFLVFHVPPFRRAVFAVALAVGRAIRRLAWEMPLLMWQSSTVRSLRYSPGVRFFHRWLGGPVVVTAVAVLVLTALGASPGRLFRWGGCVFGLAVLAMNTPWGWVLQERIGERIAAGWRLIRGNFLPGVLSTIVDWFAKLANWFERRLYAVDEWLRFRGGQSQGSLWLKVGVGVVWFPLAYLTRFGFYLLIEPQINPVKHFPVVTVSHKIILPMTDSLAQALSISEAEAGLLLACVPGIFGFIAWELMANWKLYRSNRPDRLSPVPIGSHGESMRGLLRPGFHSGTVPKVFRKMRAIDRQGARTKAVQLQHDLHHLAEAVEQFVARELVGVLEGSRDWQGLKVKVQGVHFGCQRVLIEIVAANLGQEAFALAFENRDGRIGATIEHPGWLTRLAPAQRAVLLGAVRGLLDMAGAECVDDTERTPDPATSGKSARYPELVRPCKWAEWVTFWENNGNKKG